MKVVVCHTYYQQWGGEDQAFQDEIWLLRENGHEVVQYARRNDELEDHSTSQIARNTIWNQQVYREVRALIRNERPDVLHCTNFFPLLSPSILYAAHHESVAVVQSLRNYRLICPAAVLMREGKVCEKCVGQKFAWNAIKHKCYRNSRAASAAIAGMSSIHRLSGTWDRVVDEFLTLTKFSRNKLSEGGLPKNRISIKPNMVHPDPGYATQKSNGAIYVGRLSSEKGIDVLLDAWKQFDQQIPLEIVGGGPLEELVREAAASDSRITYAGHLPFEETCQRIKSAGFLIMPSVWYETFGRTIMEAFATGTPVIASNLGAMQELVTRDETGWLFEAGNAGELASRVQAVHADPELRARFGTAARKDFESHYTPKQSYQALLKIYDKAIQTRAAKRSRVTGDNQPMNWKQV